MQRSGILARGGGLVMGLSASWNMGVASMRIASMLWMGVGLLWIVPLLLGGAVLVLALAVMIGGSRRTTVAGPLLGAAVSLMNLNLPALVLDAVALVATMSAVMRHRAEATAR